MSTAQTQNPAAFTAARLAQAAGVSQTAIRNTLSNIPATDTLLVKGQPAAAWRIAALPSKITAKFMQQARRRGIQSPAALAADPTQPWSPKLPLADLAPSLLTKAAKLRSALAATIGRINTPGISKEELARLAMPEFQREFGHSITSRRWIQILDRTINRDNGLAQWNRLEIYLDERIFSTPAPRAAPPGQFQTVADFLDTIPDPANPTRDEIALLWDTVCRQLDQTAGVSRKLNKRALVNFLHGKLSALAVSKKALDKKLRRAYRRWIALGKKPHLPRYKGRPRGVQPSQAHTRAIVFWTVTHCGGREAQGWREYLQNQIPGIQPDPAVLDYYGLHPENKSYVPRKIRDAVKHQIRAMKTIHHGPRQYGQTAHLELDDSQIPAGDVWSSDDLTPPLYFYIPDGDWFKLLRGQCLITVDQRSRRILGYALIPERGYDSISIRSHIANCMESHGLPRALVWEKGQWLKSKLLKGDADSDLLPVDIAELGLRSLGLEFRHRHRPQGKIVENTMGLVQNLMEGEPGYCGRNEQTEVFERFKKLKLAVERRSLSPVGRLYSFQQCFDRNAQLFAKYNAARQDGKLGHLSPDQTFEKFQNVENPRIRFDPSCAYLLTTHRRLVTVRDNGITMHIGKNKFVYRNRQTGELKGRQMLAWFNFQDPQILYVTDVKHQSPFAVERVQPIDPVDADPEILKAEMRRMREHQAPIRSLYNSLKTEFEQQFRANIVSPLIARNAAEFAQGEKSIKQSRTQHARKLDILHRRAQDAGISLGETPRDVDRAIGGIGRLAAARARATSTPPPPAGTAP